MKKLVSLLLTGALAFSAAAAGLADDRGAEYTLDTKGLTVLQNQEERAVPCGEASRSARPAIPGESPVTGLPLAKEQLYSPMLVQIDNQPFAVVWEKRETTGGGLGKRAPWGLQWADILYESVLYRTGHTRLTALFSDSFASGQPVSAGPVRSARLTATLLQTEWQCGAVYAGGPAHQEDQIGAMLKAEGLPPTGKLLNLWKTASYRAFANRVQGVKAPGNLNVNLVALRDFVDAPASEPRPFLFADQSPYAEGYPQATVLYLDWGSQDYLSHFSYDPATGLYQRFSGKAPYRSFADSENREESAMEPLCFANVIVQRVNYEYPGDNRLDPRMQGVGQGRTDLFIGGRYVAGSWARPSLADPTRFFDEKGEEVQLSRGKTFIALFPREARLAYGLQGR